MFLFCPKCNAQHSATGRCPRCSSRLLSPVEAAEIIPNKAPTAAPKTQIRSTFLRRVVVGVLLALGFHLTLREWAMAVLGALHMPTEPESWDGVNFALRALSTVVGAVVAGAGRKRSFSTGAIVGAASLAGYLLLDQFPHLQFEFWPIVKGTSFVVVGCLLSYLGGLIWPPPVELAEPVSPRNSSMLKLKPEHSGDREEKIPTQWVQLMIATTLIACSLMLAARLSNSVLAITPNLGEVLKDPQVLPRLQTQLAGLMMLVAGLIAGSGTAAGLRHGLIAGVVGALAMVGITVATNPEPFRIGQYVATLFGWEAGSTNVLMAIGAGAFLLALVGGVLGGSIFPRVIKQRRRRTDR
jgi:hypothetical protein